MKTKRMLSLALAMLLPAAALAAPSEAVMTYSGYLRTSSGAPETAAQSVTFKLYDAATGGNQLWSQTVAGVQPDGAGWFSVVLGASPSAFPPDGFASQTWLGIQVGGEAEMVPRQKVGAAPAALSVEYAGITGCAAANQILQWTGTAWQCIATPAGGTGGGVTSVGGATGGFITASPTSGAVSLSLTGCGATAGQILQWNGAGWSCIPTPAGGGGGVTSVSPDLSSGLTISPTTGAVVASLRRDCTAGQILKWTAAGGWGCAGDDDSGGTVTSVTAAAAPIVVGGTAAAPTIGMTQAGAASNGFVTSSDYTSWTAKVGSVTAGTGLSGGGTGASVSVAANFTTSGGTNGVAATVARGDHRHAIVQAVPLSDLVLDTGAGVVLSDVVLRAQLQRAKAVAVPYNGPVTYALAGAAPMPISAHPTLRVIVHNPDTTTHDYQFYFLSTGIVASAMLPDNSFSSRSSIVRIPAGQTAQVSAQMSAMVYDTTCQPTCPTAGAGDLIWFSFGATAGQGPAYNVLGVQLVF